MEKKLCKQCKKKAGTHLPFERGINSLVAGTIVVSISAVGLRAGVGGVVVRQAGI